MRYNVVWSKDAFGVMSAHFFLAHEKGGSPDRLDSAMNRLNELLADEPDQVGESRDGGERIAFVDPLCVLFEPFPNQRIVLIYDARVYYS